jgi:hypothetical protein
MLRIFPTILPEEWRRWRSLSAKRIAHGEPRAKIDLDVVIRIDLTDLPNLATNFEANGFYVAGLADVMRGSLRCLNITHLETIEVTTQAERSGIEDDQRKER